MDGAASPKLLPIFSVLDQGTALRAVRGGKPGRRQAAPAAYGTGAVSRRQPPGHRPTNQRYQAQRGRDGSRRGGAGHMVGASGCRTSPTPGLACHRVPRSRQQFDRQDVPGPSRTRPSSTTRTRPPPSPQQATADGPGVKESWAVSGPSGPSPGRQTPPNDDQERPSTPEHRTSSEP